MTMRADLNRAYRGKDKPTNVLSFPAADPRPARRRPLLGDIVLAYETSSSARPRDQGIASTTISPISSCMAFCISSAMITRPRRSRGDGALETRILAALGVADPYAESLAKRSGAQMPTMQCDEHDDPKPDRADAEAPPRAARRQPAGRTAQGCRSG